MSELIKILLVEDDPRVCESFRRVSFGFQNLAIVYETGSEQQALGYLLAHSVDVIILDIELAEGDGVSFLDTLTARGGEKPFVALVTNNSSGILLGYMREHGADYVYQKHNLSYSPARVLSIIDKICPYSKALKLRDENRGDDAELRELERDKRRQYLELELSDMGFSRKQVGFSYIVEALLLMMDEKDAPPRMTGEIYPLIAERYNVSAEGVEHAIRHAIEVTFRRMTPEERELYYPFAYDEKKGRPSNMDFLVRLSEKLQL
jgi:two-component system response regulator (stage 0 sporulation protein A)